MELTEQIQRYIGNQLSKEEREGLEMAIRTDPSVRSEYENHLALHRSIAQSERTALKDQLQGLRKKQVRTQRSRTLWILIGVILLLSLLGYFWFSKNQSSIPLNYYAEAYPNVVHPVTRSTPDDPYNQAFWYYEAEQYEVAAEQFALLTKEQPNATLDFYQAMSLFNVQRFQVAKSILEKLLASEEVEFQAEIRWYLALIYYRDKDFEKTKEMLEQLQVAGAGFKQSEVENLLNLLEE